MGVGVTERGVKESGIYRDRKRDDIEREREMETGLTLHSVHSGSLHFTLRSISDKESNNYISK